MFLGFCRISVNGGDGELIHTVSNEDIAIKEGSMMGRGNEHVVGRTISGNTVQGRRGHARWGACSCHVAGYTKEESGSAFATLDNT